MFNKRAGGFYRGIKPLGLARWLYAPIEPDPRVYRAVASFFVTGVLWRMPEARAL